MANNSPSKLAGAEPDPLEAMLAKKEVPAPVQTDETGVTSAAADVALEQARGQVFGDITSSNGDANNHGQHGRDGGVVAEGPSNPAPSDAAVDPTVTASEESA